VVLDAPAATYAPDASIAVSNRYMHLAPAALVHAWDDGRRRFPAQRIAYNGGRGE
jgi:hypothetical protein